MAAGFLGPPTVSSMNSITAAAELARMVLRYGVVVRDDVHAEAYGGDDSHSAGFWGFEDGCSRQPPRDYALSLYSGSSNPSGRFCSSVSAF